VKHQSKFTSLTLKIRNIDLLRSKSEAIHDHHVPKHGHVDHQDKKGGAGKGNWGNEADLIEVAEKHEVIDVFAEKEEAKKS